LGSRWSIEPALLGMVPYPAQVVETLPRPFLAAYLLPPFAPGLWLTNLGGQGPVALIAYEVVPLVYNVLLSVTKPPGIPFPYGLPVIPDAPYP